MIRGYNGKMLEYVGEIAINPGKTGFLEVPADRLYKAFHFVSKGLSFNVTYTAGAPKIHHMGVLGGLIKKLVLQNKGGEDLRTYLGISQLINDQKEDFTDRGALIYKGNSLSLAGGSSADDYVVAATTQDNAALEAFPMFMENRKSLEYYRTYYSTLGNKAAKILIDFNNWIDILDAEDASTTTAISGSGSIEVYATKADHLIQPYESFARHITSYDQIAPVGNTNSTRFTLQPEGELQGFWIRSVKVSGGKEIRFTFQEMADTVMEFKFDGETIWKGNLLAASAINMHDRPLLDVIRGATRVNLLNSKTWGTGLYTGEGSNTKAIELFLTCSVASPKFYFEYDRIRAAKQPEVAKA
jgi:hypothetical protein